MNKTLFFICSSVLFVQLDVVKAKGRNVYTMLPDNILYISSDKDIPDVIADTSRVKNLDEVVVVSQPKERQSLRYQPLSSSVFTSKELGSMGVQDISDLSSYVPSFSMPSYGSRLTSSMYVRGIGSRVNSPAVGIYFDGMPLINKSAFNFHNYQLDRVDVLRGPQGTLYGMNSEGGLLRIYSKNPMLHKGTEVKLGFGTQYYRNVEAAHYNKISDDIAFSVAAFYTGNGGFFKNTTTGKRADNSDEAGFRTRWLFALTDKFTADITADYQYVSQKAFPYGEFGISSDNVAAPSANRENSYKRNLFNVGLNLTYDAGLAKLYSATSYQYLNDCMNMDQDYLSDDFMHLKHRQLMNAVTHEMTAKSSKNDFWQWTSGLYFSHQWLKTDAPVYFDDDFTSRISRGVSAVMYNGILQSMINKMMAAGMSQTAATAAAKSAIERAGGVSVNTEMSVPALFSTPQTNIGVFHESTFNITDRFTATLGIRYDYNRVSIDYNTRAAMKVTANVMGQSNTSVLSSLLLNGSRDNYNQFLPKLSLAYRIDSNKSNVYFTVCKGYRAGGYNIQMFSDILQSELNANSQNAMRGDYDVPHTSADYERLNNTISYKPEESWNYEAGAHLNLFDGKLHADFAAYYMKIRDLQLSVMADDYGFGRMMVNAGKSYSCGLELALRGKLLDNRLSWSVSYGLSHSVFEEYKENVDGKDIDYEGNRVPFIPKHTLSVRADYEIPFNFSMVKSIVVGTDVTARGRIYWDEANSFSQQFYAVVGAHADLNMKHYGLRLWCRNLTEAEYNTFAFSSKASGSNIYLAQRGNPISAGIDLNFKF